MTTQQLLREMDKLKENDDPEEVHGDLDELIFIWFEDNGYKEIAEKIEEVEDSQKWWGYV